jgi:hypothetical protein
MVPATMTMGCHAIRPWFCSNFSIQLLVLGPAAAAMEAPQLVVGVSSKRYQ